MRLPHPLATLDQTRIPKRVIFFDSEAYTEIEITDEEISRASRSEKVWKPHDPYLVCACYHDVSTEGEHWRDYWKADFLETFWTDVEKYAPVNGKLYIFAHNAKYDIQVTAGVHHLVRLGFQVKGFSEDNPFIMRMERFITHSPRGHLYSKVRKKTIIIVSSTNYYPTSLANLGKTFKLPKLDFAHGVVINMKQEAERIQAITYCRRDVEILRAAMLAFLRFVDREDLGNFQLTIAGQSFAAFRSRFLTSDHIFIHSHPEALLVERRAYAGGRNECFRMGKVPGRVYVCDVNSMYPYTMATYRYPVRHIAFWREATPAQVRTQIMDDYLICCDVLVDVSEPIFHIKDKRLLFTTGRYWTSLSTPELVAAFDLNAIIAVKNVSIYEGDMIFAPYVDFMFKERLAAKKAKDSVHDLLFKYFLTNLYGKFGQKKENWERVDDADPEEVELIQVYDPIEKKMVHIKVFGGGMFVKEDDPDDNEAANSFPAIAAHVTAYARMLLWKVLESAGRENVHYTDTDSVFTNLSGYKRLIAAGWIDPTQLGKLDMEKEGYLYLNGCKDYVFIQAMRGTENGFKRLKVKPDRKLAATFRICSLPRANSKNFYDRFGLMRVKVSGKPVRSVRRGELYLKVQKIKGVSKFAKMIEPDAEGHLRFAVTQWTGFSARFKEKSFAKYANQVIVKTLKRVYTKGDIVAGGIVIPFKLDHRVQEAEEARKIKAAMEKDMLKDMNVDALLIQCRSYGYIRVIRKGENYYTEYSNLKQAVRIKYFRMNSGIPLDVWANDYGVTAVQLIDKLRG